MLIHYIQAFKSCARTAFQGVLLFVWWCFFFSCCCCCINNDDIVNAFFFFCLLLAYFAVYLVFCSSPYVKLFVAQTLSSVLIYNPARPYKKCNYRFISTLLSFEIAFQKGVFLMWFGFTFQGQFDVSQELTVSKYPSLPFCQTNILSL